MIPSELGFIAAAIVAMLASIVIAKERELGTLEQLMVTPLRRYELTLGKGVPAIAIGSVNFAVMWVLSLVVFRVPMNGSSPLLLNPATAPRKRVLLPAGGSDLVLASGADRVLDFVQGEDKLDLTAFGISTKADIESEASIDDSGPHLILDFGGGDTVQINGLDFFDLTNGDLF